MKESGIGHLVFPDRSSHVLSEEHPLGPGLGLLWCSHFLRMCRSEDVGDCCSSAASNRKSRRSCLADSRRSLATSDIETRSPRPSVMKLPGQFKEFS